MLALASLAWLGAAYRLATTAFAGDLRGLLHLAEARPHPGFMAGIPRTASRGYDGQFYAALAGDPFLRRDDTLAALDAPVYRSLRIGLPLLAWLAAFGRPAVAVVLYQLLCWLGAAAAVLLLARALVERGHRPWWALAAALGAGTVASWLRCTPDAAATALLLGALLAHRRGRLGSALLLLAGATVVRETSWLAAVAVGLAEAASGRLRRAAATALLPLLPLAGWLAWRLAALASVPTAGCANFGLPLTWVARKAGQLGEPLAPNPVEVVGVLAIVAILLSPLALARRAPHRDAFALTYLLFGALAWSLGWAVWSDAYAYSRVLLPLPFLAPLLASDEEDGGRKTLLLAVPATLLGVAATMGWTLSSGEAATRELPADEAASPSPSHGEPLVVLGAAHTRGQRGLWRTDLELANPLPASLTVTLEVLPTDPAARPFRPTLVRLRPREVRLVEDVLASCVRFYGVVALKLTGDRPGLQARWRTYVGLAGATAVDFTPALPWRAAIPTGQLARLDDLAHEDARGVRTDLMLLNAVAVPITVTVVTTSRSGPTETKQVALLPFQFTMLPGVLAGVAGGGSTTGHAVVSTDSPGGAFFALATVLRPDRPPLHRLP